MHYTLQDDQSLIRLSSMKDSGALSELYDRYSGLVFSLAVNIVGSREEAKDITIEVFVSIWEKAGSYQPGKASVKGWICSIARHRSIDILRRQKARFIAHNAGWTDYSSDSLPASDDPERDMELALVRRDIVKALSALPADQKKPLALAYFMGYSHQQIADKLGQPLGTVKTRIRLAIKKLRDELSDNRMATTDPNYDRMRITDRN